jgi:hypothetical protein
MLYKILMLFGYIIIYLHTVVGSSNDVATIYMKMYTINKNGPLCQYAKNNTTYPMIHFINSKDF